MLGHLVRRDASWLVTVAALALVTPAGAQLKLEVNGTTEFDSEELLLNTLDAAVMARALGLNPTLVVKGYHLVVPLEDTEVDETTNGIAPLVGLLYQSEQYAVQGTAGYVFVDGDGDEETVGAPLGAQEGFITQLQLDYHGADNRIIGQAVVSQNWGADYFWSNGRMSRRLKGGSLLLGGEIGYQGAWEDGRDRSMQAGVLGSYEPSRKLRLTLIVGGKSTDVDGTPDLFPYLKAEFLALP